MGPPTQEHPGPRRAPPLPRPLMGWREHPKIVTHLHHPDICLQGGREWQPRWAVGSIGKSAGRWAPRPDVTGREEPELGVRGPSTPDSGVRQRSMPVIGAHRSLTAIVRKA